MKGKHGRRSPKFPASSTARDNLEGRYLTVLSDGRVLVTWGVGNDNKGLRYNFSADDGQTWNEENRDLLPEMNIAARYYSGRTIQLDDQHVGTVFLSSGVQFLKINLDRLDEVVRDEDRKSVPPTSAHLRSILGPRLVRYFHDGKTLLPRDRHPNAP